MTETKVVSPISEDEAREYRSKLRCRAAALKAQRAQRKERRAERAEEIARHREAERTAQEIIEGLRRDFEDSTKERAVLVTQAIALRMQLRANSETRKSIARSLDAHYTNRQAARDALKKLHAEIVGRDGEEAQA